MSESDKLAQVEQNMTGFVNLRPQAQAIVNKYMGWGVGAGSVPVPLWDIVALGSVQALMLKDLFALYNIPFKEKRVICSVGVLLGGIAPRLVGRAALSSVLKFVPVVGQTLSAFSMPVLASASTYAIGTVFINHLENGGVMDNFNAREKIEELEQFVAMMKEKLSKKNEPPVVAPNETEGAAVNP